MTTPDLDTMLAEIRDGLAAKRRELDALEEKARTCTPPRFMYEPGIVGWTRQPTADELACLIQVWSTVAVVPPSIAPSP